MALQLPEMFITAVVLCGILWQRAFGIISNVRLRAMAREEYKVLQRLDWKNQPSRFYLTNL